MAVSLEPFIKSSGRLSVNIMMDSDLRLHSGELFSVTTERSRTKTMWELVFLKSD